MAVGMTVEIPGVTADQYQQVMDAMHWVQEPKPEGFLSHHACEKPDGLFVFDVWESPSTSSVFWRAGSAPRWARSSAVTARSLSRASSR